MKRLLKISLMLVAVMSFFVACSDDDDDDDYQTVISAESLPIKAKEFISEHFATETVTLAKEAALANPITGAKYFVYLTNAYELDFDNTGKWVNVESEKNIALPASVIALLPAAIPTYVTTNYPTAFIKEMMKLNINNTLQYKIELNTDLDLIFDANGQFIRVDK